ncbi:MAG TPA: DAK2 domain-containing protein [bacterium (Candidatus Stahlbacteria)]|nr:DAK2 domain-containing protein [Candidatus Stahlbacteria bacterium]
MPIYYCDGKRLKRTIYASTEWLGQNKELVNALNVFPVPDGDTGTNMFLTLQPAIQRIENMESDYLPDVASMIADSSLWGARGSSGVILSQILRGFAEGVGNKKRINSMDLALSLKIAAERAYAAIDQPAEGTILTVIREIAKAAIEFAKNEPDIVKLLEYILKVGHETLVNTRDMLPELKKANVIDAGGKGFLFMIEGILRLIQGLKLEEAALHTRADELPTIHDEEVTHKYCLDFIVKGDALSANELKAKIKGFGGHIVVVGSDKMLKTHIHTDDPTPILEIAQKYGIVEQVKIDNLEEQQRSFISAVDRMESERIKKEIGVVAIVSGDGLASIFSGLKVDEIVKGGQTMNPSVSDIQAAINRINADKVIILPNNSNIIHAAKQVKEVVNKQVYVVPSKTIPQGIAAMVAFSANNDVHENMKRMEASIKAVKSGKVTKAIRDAIFEGLKVEKGEYLGIHDGKIKASSRNPQSTLIALIKAMVTTEDSIISVFYSKKDEKVDDLVEKIKKIFPELDVEIHYGGQPHYNYIVSVE